MCLAIPMKLVDVEGQVGRAEIGGVLREVRLDLLEDVRAGDYVIVHAGFAIQKLDEGEAEETIHLIGQYLEG